MSLITSTNDVNIEPLINGQYAQITVDIDTALHTLGYLRINIYTDISGTTFAKDSLGNDINNRTIAFTRYSYPSTDICGNYIDGNMTITFDDGSTLNSEDWNDTEYAYNLVGLEAGGIHYFT